MASNQMLEEKVRYHPELWILHPLKASDEFSIEEYAFLFCYRVDTDKGMKGGDGIFPYKAWREVNGRIRAHF
jgi:hypothetical protein